MMAAIVFTTTDAEPVLDTEVVENVAESPTWEKDYRTSTSFSSDLDSDSDSDFEDDDDDLEAREL